MFCRPSWHTWNPQNPADARYVNPAQAATITLNLKKNQIKFTPDMTTFEITKELPNALIDPIEFDPFATPIIVNCCKQLIDKTSIQEWLAKNNTCPLCRKNIGSNDNDLIEAEALTNTIHKFKVDWEKHNTQTINNNKPYLILKKRCKEQKADILILENEIKFKKAQVNEIKKPTYLEIKTVQRTTKETEVLSNVADYFSSKGHSQHAIKYYTDALMYSNDLETFSKLVNTLEQIKDPSFRAAKIKLASLFWENNKSAKANQLLAELDIKAPDSTNQIDNALPLTEIFDEPTFDYLQDPTKQENIKITTPIITRCCKQIIDKSSENKEQCPYSNCLRAYPENIESPALEGLFNDCTDAIKKEYSLARQIDSTFKERYRIYKQQSDQIQKSQIDLFYLNLLHDELKKEALLANTSRLNPIPDNEAAGLLRSVSQYFTDTEQCTLAIKYYEESVKFDESRKDSQNTQVIDYQQNSLSDSIKSMLPCIPLYAKQ